MDAPHGRYKMHRERAWREFHNDTTCCLEQILEATPSKIVTVWPLTSHIIDHSNKTCWTLLEKQERTHKWRSSMNSCISTGQCWQASKHISSVRIQNCSIEDQPDRWMVGMDGRREFGNSVLSARLADDYISLRCPWCNGYRRRKWTRRHEFKSWTRLIAFHIALIPLGKVWIQLLSLQLWVNSRADKVLQP